MPLPLEDEPSDSSVREPLPPIEFDGEADGETAMPFGDDEDLDEVDGVVERVDLREQNVLVYELADGSQIVEQSTEPVNYRDEKGNWQRIDNQLTAGPSGHIVNRANDWKVTFKPFGPGKGNGVSVQSRGRPIRFNPIDAARVTPVIEPDGQSVRYVEAFPGVDFVYVVRGGAVQEFIEIKNRDAQSVFDFEIEGATFEAQPDGRLKEAGRSVEESVWLGAPESFTATDRVIDPANHIFETGTSGRATAGSDLTIGLSPEYVQAAAPEDFPLVIDPDVTPQLSPASVASYGLYLSNGSQYGFYYDSYARVGNPYLSSSSSARWRSVVHFDYGTSYYGRNVRQARLSTSVVSGSGSGTRSMNVYWAMEWGNHFSVQPARLNPIDKKNPAPVLRGWYPTMSTAFTSGTQYHTSVTAPDATTPQPGLGYLYNYWFTNNQTGALLLQGEEQAGVYTYKKMSLTLKLWVNGPLTGGTDKVISVGSPRNKVTWGFNTAPSDPEGATIRYAHDIRTASGGINPCQEAAQSRTDVTARTATCTILPAYFNTPLTYHSVADDGDSDLLYRNGVVDNHQVKTTTRTFTLQNSPPSAPAQRQSPSPEDGKFYGQNLTPTLKVSAASDPNGDPVQYQFRVCPDVEGLNGCANQATLITSPWQASRSWTVPAGLSWGKNVVWDVRARDTFGNAESNLSPSWSFFTGRTTGTNEELGGGWNPYSGDTADVDPSNGNFRTSATDVSIPAVAMPLEVTRTYNSLHHNVSGPFGNGWASSVGMHLERELDTVSPFNTVGYTVVYPDGRRAFHGLNPDGSFGNAVGSGNEFVSVPAESAFKLIDPSGATYTFDSTSLALESLVNDNDQTVTFADPSGNGTSRVITDVASGRELTLTLDTAQSPPRVTQVATAPVAAHGNAPLVWKYYYSGQNLTAACNPTNNALSGDCTRYFYDASGRLDEVTLPEGNTDAEITYIPSGSNAGRVSSRADGYGDAWTFSYGTATVTSPTGANVTMQRTTVLDPRGPAAGDPNRHRTYYDFDDERRLKHSDDLHGGQRWYVFDDGGFLAQVSQSTSTGYIHERYVNDDAGRVLTHTDAAGHEWTSLYNTDGRLLESSEPALTAGGSVATTIYTYDGNGNKLTETDPLGNAQSWTYTPGGQVETHTDANGNVTTYEYTPAGQLLRRTDPTLLQVEYLYDEIGRVTRETQRYTNTATAITYTTYDKLSRRVTTTEPYHRNQVTGDLHRRRFTRTYDKNSNVLSITESDTYGNDASRVTAKAYDLNDREYQVTDALGGITTRTFDQIGNVVTVTDAGGRIYAATYDHASRQLTDVLTNFVDPTVAAVPRSITLSTMTYDVQGRQATRTDALGNVVSTEYDVRGNMVSEKLLNFVPLSGASFDFVVASAQYDSRNRAYEQEAANGQRRVTYTFDDADRPTTETIRADVPGFPMSDRVVTKEYDANGNLRKQVTTQDGRSDEVRMTYDAGNQVITSTIEAGTVDLVTRITRDRRGLATRVYDPLNRNTITNYDKLGQAYQVRTHPEYSEVDGQAPVYARPRTRTGFDTFGNPTDVQDPLGNETSVTFDKLDRRTEIMHPAYTPPGSNTAIVPTEQFGYDPVGNMIWRTNRLGHQSDFEFDSLNRVVRELAPSPDGIAARPESTFEYDDNGNTTSTTNTIGAQTLATYDKLGFQRTTTEIVRNGTSTPDSYVTTYGYDGAGNVTSVQAPDGSTTTSIWARTGELLRQTDALGKSTSYAYDVGGRLLSTTDPLGRSTRNTYDTAGRMTKTAKHDLLGVQVAWETYAHDKVGNVTSRTSASGNTTQYAYDRMYRLKSVKTPTVNGLVTTSYAYDLAGNQTRATDGNGEVWYATYNSWGMIESRIEPATGAHPSAVDRTFTAVYNAAGQPVEERLPGSVVVSRTYDNLGRLTAESGGAAGGSKLFELDAAGRVIEASHPNGTIAAAYNDRNQLTDITGPASASSFAYDTNGRMTSRTDDAGTTQYSWTVRNELAGLADPVTGDTRTYSWSDASQLETVDYGNGATRTYTRDPIGRISTDTLQDDSDSTVWSASYGYDLDDNLTSKTVGPSGVAGAGTNTYAYDGSNRLISWNGPGSESPTTYTWDGNGNRLTAGSEAFTYDERNRLLTEGNKSYTWSARGTVATITDGTETTAYTFDGLGRMTAAGDIDYTYDSLDRIARRETVPFKYSGFDQQPTSDGVTTVAHSPAGRPISISEGTTRVHLGLDRHGDATVTFEGDGDIIDTVAYDPFGVELARTGATELLVGFQGHYTDPSTGLVDMGARWYQPSTATFLSRDTVHGMLETPVTLNRYTYGQNNPLSMFDPDGRYSFAEANGLKRKSIKRRPAYAHGTADRMERQIQKKAPRGYQVNRTPWKIPRTWTIAEQMASASRAEANRFRALAPNGAAKQHRKEIYAQIVSSEIEDPATRAQIAVAIVTDYFVDFDVAKTRDPSDANGDIHPRDYERIADPNNGFPEELQWAARQVLDQDLQGMHHTKKSFGDQVRGSADLIKTGLSFVPIVGDAIDAWDCLNGDILSCAAMIPLAGTAANAAKAARAVDNAIDAGRAADNSMDALRALDNADVLNDFDNVADTRRAASCNSFVPGTRVLMADGSTKPIEDVDVGEEVLATDPETGEEGPRAVTRLITGHGTKTLVDITTDGATVTSTDLHPIWEVVSEEWIQADELDVGDVVYDNDGDLHTLDAVDVYEVHDQTVHNLTVADIHTFYVQVGEESILTHNTNRLCDGDGLTSPGPHAGESIPARGPERDFTAAERAEVDRIGQATGCHRCGDTDPGTRSGHHIPDHQPVSALSDPGVSQRLYPHCLLCSRVQGGTVSQIVQAGKP